MIDSRKISENNGLDAALKTLDPQRALYLANNQRAFSDLEAGKFLLFLIKNWLFSNQLRLRLENDLLREIELLLIRHPRLAINVADEEGNTALHYVVQEKENFNRWLLDLLCAQGADISQANNQGKTPLELGLHHPYYASDLVKYLLQNYSVSDAVLKEVIYRTYTYKQEDLAEWFAQTYPHQVRALNADPTKRLLHQAVNFPKFDGELIQTLLDNGATLQDTNGHNQTVHGVLIKHENYNNLEKLVWQFDDKLTLDQHKNIFSQLYNAKQTEVYNNYLSILSAKKYSVPTLKDIMHDKVVTLAPNTFKNIAFNVMNGKEDDLSYLELINLVKGKPAEKKQVFCDVIFNQINRLKTAESLVNFMQKLDQLCLSNKYLEFLRRRYSMSFTGHTWKGMDACYTWVKIIEKVKARILDLTAKQETTLNQDVYAFLKTATRKRTFCFFQDPSKLAAKYAKLCNRQPQIARRLQ